MRPVALAGLALLLGGAGALGMRHAATLRAEVATLQELQSDFALERTAAEAALRAEEIRLALERARQAPFAAAAPYLELILEDGRLLLGKGEARLREISVVVELTPGIRAVERIEGNQITFADAVIPLLPADFEALRAVLRVGDLAYVH
jgi:hypothetical protein